MPPVSPLIGSINLTPAGTSGEQFQSEISTYVSTGGKLFLLSSGGGQTLQVTDATIPTEPKLVARVEYGPYTSTSVAAYKDLVAVALVPADYDANPSRGIVRFFRMGTSGDVTLLTFLQDVQVGYLGTPEKQFACLPG